MHPIKPHSFLSVLFFFGSVGLPAGIASALSSPDGQLTVNVATDSTGRLTYNMSFKNAVVMQTSALGISVGGVDLGANAQIGTVTVDSLDQTYPMLGRKSQAVNRYQENRIAVTSGSTAYRLDMRAFNDGIAFRYVVPGTGSRTVNGEMSSFTFPAGSTVYYQTGLQYYEDNHQSKDISALTTADYAGPPLTVKLPGTQGYASVTEGALVNYSGMTLRGAGNRILRANFQNAIGAVQDTITSPWRIVMIASDLNGLVNCDIPQHVSPAPDPLLFPQGPQTPWIKPGRSAWSWLAANGRPGITAENMRAYSLKAGQLGWEYNIIDDGWAAWTNAWDTIKAVSDYAKARNVKTIAWVRYDSINTTAKREAYFAKAAAAGLAGLKIDFMNSESRAISDWYPIVLRLAAQYQMVLDFHGAGKPSGLDRTWPNELTREAIKGREASSANPNNLYYPFTRYLAGNADYTPLRFGNLGSTSYVHQIAGAVIYTSPLLVIADDPAAIQSSPAVEVIKGIPSTWDETRVLPPSEINDIAVFARRKGTVWYLAILNAATQKTNLKIPLSFLPPGTYNAQGVRDNTGTAATLVMDAPRTHVPSDSVTVTVRAWGGFVMRLQDPNAVGIRPAEARAPGRVAPAGAGGARFDLRGRHVPGKAATPVLRDDRGSREY